MFQPAKRTQAKIKMAITGPSGSGKTYSALLLATGLVPNGKIALIDTENNSASLYADRFKFDTAPIAPPYTTEKYIAAIRAAEKAGYDVLIIDSLTHAWAGEGGLLQQKESLDAGARGNSYTNWAKMTPKQEQFVAAILHSNIHVISTIRSKQDYILRENSKGKQEPVKVGMAPVQRDGMEYEFTIVFDVAMSHEAIASKDRTGIFTEQTFKITEDTGASIGSWLSTAEPEPKREQMQATATTSSEPFDPEALSAAEYIPTFGKFKDHKLGDIDVPDLANYVAWLEDGFAKTGHLPKPHVAEFIRQANRLVVERQSKFEGEFV